MTIRKKSFIQPTYPNTVTVITNKVFTVAYIIWLDFKRVKG